MSKDVFCYHCDSNFHSSYLEQNDYTLVKCQRCGLLYVAPRPSNEPGPLDAGHYHKTSTRFQRRRSKWIAAVFNELAGPLPANATWLDLGARAGEAISAAESVFGHDLVTVGLEPDMRLAKIANRKDFDVTYFQLYNHATRYDVISAFDIFTKLDNPRNSLLQWAHLLMPNGILYLQVPNTAELASFEHPQPLDLPRNLSFPSQTILESLLTDVGLRVEAIAQYPLSTSDLKACRRDKRPLNLVFKARAV